jgi:hypothetical protein
MQQLGAFKQQATQLKRQPMSSANKYMAYTCLYLYAAGMASFGILDTGMADGYNVAALEDGCMLQHITLTSIVVMWRPSGAVLRPFVSIHLNMCPPFRSN